MLFISLFRLLTPPPSLICEPKISLVDAVVFVILLPLPASHNLPQTRPNSNPPASTMTATNGVNGAKAPKPTFPAEAATREYAASLDKADPLRALRDEFIIPSKANLATKKLAKPGKHQNSRKMHRERNQIEKEREREKVACGERWSFADMRQKVSPLIRAFTSAVTRSVSSPRRLPSTWKPSWTPGHQSEYAAISQNWRILLFQNGSSSRSRRRHPCARLLALHQTRSLPWAP